MHTAQTQSLSDQAYSILKSAITLENGLKKHELPQPSFCPRGRKNWHDIYVYEDLFQTRLALIESLQTLTDLVLGPVDLFVRGICLHDVNKISVIRTLQTLNVASAVPLDGTISIVQLGANLGVNHHLLHRHLKFAYTVGFFTEPEPGRIAHTAFSAVMPEYSAIGSFALSKATMVGQWSTPQAMRIWDDPSDTPKVPLTMEDPQHRSAWEIVEDPAYQTSNEQFGKAMLELHHATEGSEHCNEISGFNWRGLGQGLVIDVGGGIGHFALAVAQAVPKLNFVVQDLEKNREASLELIREHGLEDRVRFEVHDFFKPQPRSLKRTVPRSENPVVHQEQQLTGAQAREEGDDCTQTTISGTSGESLGKTPSKQPRTSFPEAEIESVSVKAPTALEIAEVSGRNGQQDQQETSYVHMPESPTATAKTDEDNVSTLGMGCSHTGDEDDGVVREVPKAYLLSHILHDWQEAEGMQIVAQLLPGMEQGARLFVCERNMPDHLGQMTRYQEREARWTDISMFMYFGARERTVADWKDFFRKVDPRLRVAHVSRPISAANMMLEVVMDT